MRSVYHVRDFRLITDKYHVKTIYEEYFPENLIFWRVAMFTFFHTYTEDTFEGLFRQNLFREGDGLKMAHTMYMPQSYKFNEAARPGMPLYERVKSLGCPFYIDRLQGGIPFTHWYAYDPELIDQWKEMLGDNFCGFQIHEWASNYNCCDRGNVQKLYDTADTHDPTPEQKKAIWDAVRNGEKKIWIEAMYPDEWAAHRLPMSQRECIDDLYMLYSRRREMASGNLIPADSFYMAPRIEIENGSKILLPEVGWQIPGMRIQMAYTRAQAEIGSVRWGIYYECWGYSEKYRSLMIPLSLCDTQDEWLSNLLRNGAGASDSTMEERERGGSSRNLQERAWRYAYLSGATVMGEEYGVCTTFRNTHDFDLSPYGQVKHDFLRFTERFSEIGRPYTPVAVVLPAEMPVVDVMLRTPYLDYPYRGSEDLIPDAQMDTIRETMALLFGTGRKYGNHSHVICNSSYPDIFDIIHADQTDAIARYDYLIDLTGDPAFAQAHSNCVAAEALSAMLDTLLPFRVDGDLHTMYNRTADGWLLLIMNNEGILIKDFSGDIQMPEAAIDGRLHHLCGEWKLLDGNTAEPQKTDDGCTFTLGGGEWMLLGISCDN